MSIIYIWKGGLVKTPWQKYTVIIDNTAKDVFLHRAGQINVAKFNPKIERRKKPNSKVGDIRTQLPHSSKSVSK